MLALALLATAPAAMADGGENPPPEEQYPHCAVLYYEWEPPALPQPVYDPSCLFPIPFVDPP